ncbi:hypothetical protein JNW91_25850, partial [Micromonospora sp. STR1_7]|nr:hypothetical protein [Micromonospora parastrephiae]
TCVNGSRTTVPVSGVEVATALVMAVLAMSAQLLVGLAGQPPLGQAVELTFPPGPTT